VGLIKKMIEFRRREKVVRMLAQRLQDLHDSHPALYADLAKRWNDGEIDGVQGLVEELNTIRKGW